MALFLSIDLLICRILEETDVLRVLNIYFEFTSWYYCICSSLVFSSAEKGPLCLPGRLSHPARRPLRSLLGCRKEVAASSRKKAAQDLGHMETHRRGTSPCPWKQLLWTAHPASSNSSCSPSFLETRMPQARPTSASSGWRVSWMDNLQWNAFPF